MSNTKIPYIIRRRETANVVTRDCDCACSTDTSRNIQKSTDGPIIWPNMVQKTPGIQTTALSRDHYLAFLPSGGGIGDGIAVLNKTATEILSHYEQPLALTPHLASWQEWGQQAIEITLANLLDLGFLTVAPTHQAIISESNNVLSVWLHITDRCNLHCSYCYLPHKPTDIDITIGYAAIDAAFRSAITHSYNTIKLKYAGGEPLLHFPLILKLHYYAQTLARQYNLTLDGIILSNGTLLTKKTIKQMQAANLRLMISLDGIGTMHDCQRHYADGSGSFTEVATAIDRALNNGLVPDISVTVSRRNVSGLPETVAWILERDLPFSLNFYRKNMYSTIHKDLSLEEIRIIEGMLAAYKVIEHNLPRHCLLASLVDRSNLSVPHLRPCSAGKSYLVFDTQGCVAKCQMELNNPVTNYHDFDPLATVRASTQGLINPKVDEKVECDKCKWRYWCGGGCPLQAYHATGQYNAKSPNCNIYKALYPKVIELEGLRLLKYAEDNIMETIY